LSDVGIAGATFGVAGDGYLDWIPPDSAGCVDWTTIGPDVNFGKDVIMQFRLVQAEPGALLWVLDGDASWNGRLYDVGPDGTARYVTSDYWTAQQAHFQAVWKNVMPVSWTQLDDLQRRGMVGADLR
jgi:hypothetical protein